MSTRVTKQGVYSYELQGGQWHLTYIKNDQWHTIVSKHKATIMIMLKRNGLIP